MLGCALDVYPAAASERQLRSLQHLDNACTEMHVQCMATPRLCQLRNQRVNRRLVRLHDVLVGTRSDGQRLATVFAFDVEAPADSG